MTRLFADFTQALRLFRTSPGFAAVIVAIALGIGAGGAVGLAAAFHLSSSLGAFAFGVGPRAGFVFVMVPAALTLIGLATVAIVARRARRIDPPVALRHE